MFVPLATQRYSPLLQHIYRHPSYCVACILLHGIRPWCDSCPSRIQQRQPWHPPDLGNLLTLHLSNVLMFIYVLVVCAIHPVFHQFPAALTTSTPHNRALDLRRLDNGVLRVDCRRLRPRWSVDSEFIQVGLLCLRSVGFDLHLVSRGSSITVSPPDSSDPGLFSFSTPRRQHSPRGHQHAQNLRKAQVSWPS